MAIAEVRESTRGNAIEKMKGINIGDLLVPGLFILIFSLLVLFVYVPSLQNTYEMKTEIDQLNSKQDDLRRNLEIVQTLDEQRGQVYTDLQNTKKIIPKNLDVADFAYFVDKLARESGLRFQEIKQSDCISSNNSRSRYDRASSVCGPISYTGKYQQIVDFLDKLQDESPYIVEVLKLDLKSDNADGSKKEEDIGWKVELDISGLYLPEDVEVNGITIYQKMVPYTSYPELLEIFEYKAEILEENPEALEDPREELQEDQLDEEDEDE